MNFIEYLSKKELIKNALLNCGVVKSSQAMMTTSMMLILLISSISQLPLQFDKCQGGIIDVQIRFAG